MRYPQLKRDALKFWENGEKCWADGLLNTSEDTDFFYIAVYPGFKSKTGWIYVQEPSGHWDIIETDHLRFDDDGVIVWMQPFPHDGKWSVSFEEAGATSHNSACYFIQEMELCD